MAIFTKDTNNTVLGTSSADIILVPFGPFGDTGFIAGGAGADELRFSSLVADDFLVIADNISGIERVVIGTGAGATAVTSGLLSLGVDATESVNALAITGNAGANLVFGTLFNDTITGGAGADELYGGAGNDIFIVASAAHHPLSELIDGEGGFDTVRFTSTVAGNTLVMSADDDVEAIVIGTATGVTTGTVALNVDASAMANFSGTRITGNAGRNQLTGTDYADVLAGGLGADTLNGGAGNDTVVGGAGADSMTGGEGDDLFVVLQAELAGDVFAGGAGTDDLRIDSAAAGATFNLGAVASGIEFISFGAALQNVAVNVNADGAANGIGIFGTNAANTITGTSFRDFLSGGGGNDVFIINAAADHVIEEGIEGGSGTDEIRFAGLTGTLELQGGFISGVERVSVSSGANVGIDASQLGALRIAGGSGNNTLLGGAEDDTLVGGGGADSLDGGEGNDLYLYNAVAESVAGEVIDDSGEDGTDVVEYAGTTGVLVLRAGLSGIEVARLGGSAATGIDASGSGASLLLLGNIAGNVLTGCDLEDTLSGGLGRDTLSGGGGDDLFTGTGAELSTDLINGGAGFDAIVVTGTAQAVLGASITAVESVEGRNINAGAVTSGLALTGDEDLASTLLGGLGADTILGGAGADRLAGGGGNDRFMVDTRARLAGDTVDGGAGTDVLFFTHDAEEPLASYFEGLGLPGGPALLLGMDGMKLAGVEEIRIAGADGVLDDAPGWVIADGSLQGSIFIDAPDEFTLDQITDESFITGLLFAGSLDPLINIVDSSLLELTREQQLTFIMDVINNNPEFALSIFNAFLSDLLQDQELEIGGFDALYTAAGLTITGNHGNNVIAGTAFTDKLAGNGGDDVFLVSSGAHHPLEESIQGGAGHDEVWFTSLETGDTLVLGFADGGIEAVRVRTLDGLAQGTVNVDATRLGAAVEISGNDAANVLTGSRFGDFLAGGFGEDLLQGGRGDDTLVGGANNDALQGGLGNDLILNPHASLEEIDALNGGAGTDTVRINDGSTFDMTQLGRRGFAGIERIELSTDGDSGNSVVVTFDRVVESVGDGGVLTIDGTDGDRVQLLEEWVGGVAEGGYIDWTFADLDSDTQATLRIDEDIEVGRAFIAVAGPDTLIGGPTADTFVFTLGTLDTGDVATGAGGFDTIELLGNGDIFDMSKLTLSGLERIRLMDGGHLLLADDQIDVVGSAFDDTIEAQAADLPAQVDGGEGLDTALLHLDGDDTLNGSVFESIEQIQVDGGGELLLQGDFVGAVVAQDDEDYDLTLDGANVTVFLGGGNDSIVAGTALDVGGGSVNAGGGADTLDGVPLGMYSVDLGDGDDLYIRDAVEPSRSVSGGGGFDTMAYDGADELSVTLGDGSFEVLAAGDATGTVKVTVSDFGSEPAIEITTGSGNDVITLAESSAEVVHTGDGADGINTPHSGDEVSLDGGDDTFEWDYNSSLLVDWTIDGGAGADTLHFQLFSGGDVEQVTIDFSTAENVEGVVSNFENLDGDAAGVNLQFIVTAAAAGSVITTSSNDDEVFLGAGADDVTTGAGNDTVSGALGAADDIKLGDEADTFELTGPVANGGVVDAGEDFSGNTLRILAGTGDLAVDLSFEGTVFLNFEHLDADEATGDLTITADNSILSVASGSGDDVLLLNAGLATLFGGDFATLGTGNDAAEFSAFAKVDGGDGSDTVTYFTGPGSSVTVDLAQSTAYVNFENFDGSASSTDQFVSATGFGSLIETGSGSDLLDGAAGNDTLTSGSGTDTFRIDTTPDTDVDVLVDFNPASDFLELEDAAFAGITGAFSLNPDQLALGTAAADADDYLIYDQTTGNLYYDADGNGAGEQALFAVLSNQAALTAADIMVS